MTRNICITGGDGHTGFLIAELILTNSDFKNKVDSVSVLCLHPTGPRAKELAEMGAKIIPHKPGRSREMVKTLTDSGCDTVCLIPPAHKEKFDITVELINATKKANVPNVLFISAVGCDVAEREKQPHLREFIDLECLIMAAKGDGSTATGHSPCIIRAGFYAEAQKDGILPIPIGESHLLAPVALGDISQLAAHILTGQGENGFDDRHRGQLMVCTGPLLCTGAQLAEAASKVLGTAMQFEDISEAEAKKVLKVQSDYDPSELLYLLEYYSLVREGKTNYISTTAFFNVTGNQLQQPEDFFKMYKKSFMREGGEGGHVDKKRKA
ncbi:NAD(P)-binding protein [Clathrospora elynae]|uniref:NAD(P)-binding protein n=1 Tax=Clathrospora elynae TaxID=706981 RepID=A0A6A5SKK7_9PLEO|nr:NAD(P)-binding protein [Clathrospora elynae]